ncbi:MAG: hypothetical protein ABT20_03160 [Rubrivivax sp. SCN 70-15]|nr:MAG: hypothetical protein ABT20_03160 [Rubrivivax sp. SCN 70-15]
MNGVNANIIWVLIALAAVWFLLRRGRHGGHGQGGFGGHGHGGFGGRGHDGGGHHGGSHERLGNASPRDHDALSPGAAIDPVSGKPVRTDQALTSVNAGRTYYFESEDTRRRFEAEPQRYATAAPPPQRRSRRHGC